MGAMAAARASVSGLLTAGANHAGALATAENCQISKFKFKEIIYVLAFAAMTAA